MASLSRCVPLRPLFATCGSYSSTEPIDADTANDRRLPQIQPRVAGFADFVAAETAIGSADLNKFARCNKSWIWLLIGLLAWAGCSRSPQPPDAYLRGTQSLDDKKFGEAISAFADAIAENPMHAQAGFRRASRPPAERQPVGGAGRLRRRHPHQPGTCGCQSPAPGRKE